MAGIVKKIGRITKYETTDYVGSAQMLDLDRATARRCEPLERPSSTPRSTTRARPASSRAVAPADRPAPVPTRRRTPTSAISTDSRTDGGKPMTFDPPTRAAQLAALRELATELPLATQRARRRRARARACSALLPGPRARGPRRSTSATASRRARTCAARRCATASPRRRHAHAGGARRARGSRARSRRARGSSSRERWDSPFTGIATGFAMPLAAGGELYGVLDVGYRAGRRRAASTTSRRASRSPNQPRGRAAHDLRLQDDAIGLRDYQARLLDSANALILGIDRDVADHGVQPRAARAHRLRRATSCSAATSATSSPTISASSSTTAFAAALAGQHHAAVTVDAADARRRHGAQRVERSRRSAAPVSPAVRSRPSSRSARTSRRSTSLQQQIVRAERLATLGELAAGVVHELNNPLTSITVYAEYLVRKLESQGAEAADLEKLRRIGASAQRILRFSRDLVQYARPSGKELEPVDLAAVVRQSVSICEHLRRARRHRARRRGRSRAAGDPGGRRPARAGADQPDHERGARGRERRARSWCARSADGPATVVLEVARLRPGRPRRGSREDLRAVLHDQAGRQGHRPRPADRAQHRRAAPRADLGGALRSRRRGVSRDDPGLIVLTISLRSGTRTESLRCRSGLIVWLADMKPEVMLELLEAAADQLGIKVSYEPLQTGGIRRSARRAVQGEGRSIRVIVDKRATDEERVATLATALGDVRYDRARAAAEGPRAARAASGHRPASRRVGSRLHSRVRAWLLLLLALGGAARSRRAASSISISSASPARRGCAPTRSATASSRSRRRSCWSTPRTPASDGAYVTLGGQLADAPAAVGRRLQGAVAVDPGRRERARSRSSIASASRARPRRGEDRRCAARRSRRFRRRARRSDPRDPRQRQPRRAGHAAQRRRTSAATSWSSRRFTAPMAGR